MKTSHAVILVAALFAAACSGGSREEAQSSVEQSGAEASGAAAEKASAGVVKKEIKPAMEKLMNPAKANAKAPETFKAKFNTTKGDFIIEVNRSWAPLGADRFYNMVISGYFTDIAFFRVIEGFMAQFGIHGDPAVAAAWRGAAIEDDPVKQSNLKGYVSYAMAGPGTRTTQMFINYGNNSRLDAMGFSPFGKVTSGMAVVESIYSGYGEGAPRGSGPEQGVVQTQGNKYLKAEFPKMDFILGAELLN